MSGRDDVIATLKKENRQLRFQLIEVTEEKDDTIAALANENQQLKDQYQEMMQKYADLKTEYQGLNRVQDRTARPGTFELTAQATQEAEKVLGFVKELTCTVDARPTPEIDPDTLDLHAKDLIDSFEPFMRTMQAQEDWIKIAQPVVESAQKHLPLILQQMEKVQAILHEHQQHLRRGEGLVKELTNRLNTWKAAGLQLRTLMSSVEDANADARK
jgi:septal ring factor EnvC (AmiA/AmiB activator)